MATLAEAFAEREFDPHLAAELFDSAGPGPILEEARFRAWYRTLGDFPADAASWSSYLDARPPENLFDRATLALADVVEGEGDREGAIAILTEAPESIRSSADLRLLDLADDATAARAAHRLARNSPLRLRNHSRSLERAALEEFTPGDWLARAAAWRRLGLGSRGAAEIRNRRFGGDEETARRRELVRCELDAGSTTRALNALPSARRSEAEDHVLRAEAYRRRGWGRFPERAAGSSFATCLAEARRALGSDPATDQAAAVLVLECGTESGELDAALSAWRDLEASGWTNRRRSWLGRRLGVALAKKGGFPDDVRGIATALPQHDRCLRFWQAVATSDQTTLNELASAPVEDLYGRWSAELDPSHERRRYTPPDPVGPAEPPPAVDWLLDHAGPSEAVDEWQWLFRRRQPTRREALAAAELAAATGRANTAIRHLRSGFPGIASVEIADTPPDAARAYLPLRYTEFLLAAADESGLDPWLIAAVARQESTFIAHARSPAGARGVLQLLPSTARLHSRALGLGSSPKLEDPEINLRLGSRELATLVRKYGAIEPALAAYNAGERRVRRWWRKWPDARLFAESVPISETYTYIRRVVFLSEAYRQIHADAWEERP